MERGVLQGSVLSPTRFLVVMNLKLEYCSVGPCLRDLYCGTFAPADIRTISTGKATLDEQISLVESFTATNALVLNVRKCEVVVVYATKPTDDTLYTVSGHQLAPSTLAKCLGHWRLWDLSSDKAVNCKSKEILFFCLWGCSCF